MGTLAVIVLALIFIGLPLAFLLTVFGWLLYVAYTILFD